MTKRYLLILIPLIGCFVIQTAACSLSVHQDDPDTQIQVSVLYPDSSPVPGFVLVCYDQDKVYEVQTDENGNAVFKLKDTKERIVRIVIGGGLGLGWTKPEMQKYETWLRSIHSQYYCEGIFRKGRFVPVSAGLTTDVEFKFVRTSQVSGRAVIQTSDTPLEMPTCNARISTRSIAKLQKDGSFLLHGIPKQQDNELYFWAYPEVYIASIASEQMNQQNVDVGLIKIKPSDLPAKAKLDIEVQDGTRKGYSRHTWSPGITMIHESGEVIYSFWGHNGQLRVLPKHIFPPPLPAGRYWLAPGHLGPTDLQLAVIDGVRTGLINEDTDLQSIVLRAGETTTGTIILNDIAEDIAAFIEKTDWKRENIPKISKSDDE